MDTKNFIIYLIIFLSSIFIGIFIQWECNIIKEDKVAIEIKPEPKFFDKENVKIDSTDVPDKIQEKYPTQEDFYRSEVTFEDSTYKAKVELISIEPLPPDIIASINFKLLELPVRECNCEETVLDKIKDAVFYTNVGIVLVGLVYAIIQITKWIQGK